MKKNKLFLALIGLLSIGHLAFSQAGSTFSNSDTVTSLPFIVNGESTCGFGNNYTTLNISCIGNFMSGDEKIYSFTPASNMSNIEVSISNISDNFSGLFVTDDTTASGTCLGALADPSSNDRVISNLTLAGGTTYYIVVSTWANPQCISSYDIAILDQTCPAPSMLTASNVTATSADFNWVENGASTNWTIEYGPLGFLPGTGTIVPNATNPINVSNLSASTDYEFYVRAVCSASDSSYLVGPASFTTPCLPTTAPNTESFDNPSIPFCWSNYSVQGGPWRFGGTPGYGASGAQDHTGNGGEFIWMDFSGTDVGVSLETGDYDVSALTTPYLEFFFYTNNTNNNEMNDLMVEAWDGSSWSLVDSIHQNLGGWTKFGYNVNTHVYGNNLVRFRFRAESGGATTDFYQDFLLDDITVMEIPSCPDPSSLAAAPVGQSALVSWTEQGSATNWEIEWDVAGFTPGTGNLLPTINNPETITGLTVTTNYEYYVRSVCGAGDSSLWVGPFAFTTTPLCPEPVNLTANVVGNSAELYWAEVGSAVLWEYEYGAAGFSQGSGTMDTTSFDSLALTGLNYSSTYQFYVRAICGPGDTSAWAGPNSFVTPCAVNIPYYAEDFTSFVPNCWDEAADGTQATGPTNIGFGNWRASTVFGNTSVALNLYTTGWNEWVLSPYFDLSAGGYEIAIDVAVTNWLNTTPDAMGSDDTVKVLYTEDGVIWDTIASYTAANSLSNSLTTFTYPISSTGSNVQFAIHGSDGTVNDIEDYDFHFDNFIIRIPPTCPAPSLLVMNNITGTSADFSWTENGSATLWEVQYDTVGFVMGTGTIDTTSVNPYSISGLTPSTSYDTYVRSICGTGDSSVWIGPINFATAFNAPGNITCSTGGLGLVFSDDMESNSGWTGDISTSAGDWDFPTASPGGNSGNTGPSGPASGTTFAEFEASGAGASAVATMVSPMIDLSVVTNSAELSFYMHAYGQTMGNLEVGVGTSAAGPFTTLFTHNGEYQTAANDPWAHIGVDLTSYVGQQIYIAFTNYHLSTSFYGDRAIDLVEVRGCVSCPAPDSLSIANLNSTSVDLSWAEMGSATTWEVSYSSTLGGGPGSGTLISTTTNPHALSGLSSSTNYEYYVRSICGSGDTSAWAGPFAFATTFTQPGNISCSTGGPGIIFSDDMEANTGWTGDISTSPGDWDFPTAAPGGNSFNTGPSGPASGTTFAEFEASGAGATAVATMVTPMIDLSNVTTSAELSFYMHAYGQTMGNLDVGVGNSATGPFTSVFTHNGEYQTAATDPWAHIGVDISAYVGQQIYIAFTNSHLSTSFYGDRAIDLVEVRGCVSCPAPDSLNITNLNPTSVDLGWNENGSATNWEIEYDDSTGFVLGSGTGTRFTTTTNPHALTGLNADSDYEYYVRSICGPGDTSSWAGPFSFQTPCAIITSYPFTENFDLNSPTLSCWRNNFVTGNGAWGVAQGALGGSITAPFVGAYNLVFVSQNGTNTPTTNAVSPTFDLTGLALPRMHFAYAQESFIGQNYLRVLYRISATDPWVEIWSDSNEVTAWTQVTLQLPNPSANYQIAFQGINNWGRRNVVDEMIVEDTPANDLMVIDVASVSSNCGLGSDSIKATIVNNGSAAQTGFSMVYSMDGVAITPEVVSATIAASDTMEYTFTTMANFATAGTVDFEAYSILTGDFDLSNDTVEGTISKTFFVDSYPYLETFATGEQGWEIDNGPNGSNGSWAFGNPSKPSISGAASDTNAFVTGGLTGNYGPNELAYVYSPCFDFTSLNDPYVQMSVWYESEWSWDGGQLQYSTDGGTVWEILGEVGEGENWYRDNTLNGLGNTSGWCGRNGSGNTGGSNGWLTATISAMDLAGLSDVKFRIAFGSDGSIQDEGFGFDDFAIFNGATLGNDTILCTNDTMTLDPGSYSGYLWSDSSITPLYYIDAAVTPEGVDTINVIVSGPGGFKMFDTVVVGVEKPTVTLGTDTVLCYGESIVLTADSGFASYLWSNSATTQSTSTDGSIVGGTDYSVIVNTINGCPATDTINVNVNTEVLVDLGADTMFYDELLQGTTYLLDAGPGFASYTWSDGSSTQTITIDSNQTDTIYTVVVTNASGCEGSDTVIVIFNLSVDGGISFSTISMYPNPTTDIINISVSNFASLGDVEVKVLDITGKVVMKETLQGAGAEFNETYDVSRLATGTYFVQFEAQGEVVTRQFVIK